MRSVCLDKLTGGQELNLELLHKACLPYVHTFKYPTPIGYKVESLINYDLGITTETLYRLVMTNIVYAGTNLTPERKAKQDKAFEMQYRHCKIMKSDTSFLPPPHEPQTRLTVSEGHLVTVTTDLQVALNFFAGYQP